MNMAPIYAELRRFAYKTLVMIGALTLCVGLATATTTIGTNITTDGTLNVGSLFGIATSAPGSLLSVGGITNFTTATSTFYSSGGINLSSGCYAVNGTCVGGGGGGGTTPSPLPFFGTQTSNTWVRPGLSEFNSWINQVDSYGGTAPTTATAVDYASTLSTPGLPLVVTFGVGGSYPGAAFPRILLKSIGAPPWTITVAFAAFSNVGANIFIPIYLYDTPDQTGEEFFWYQNSNAGEPVFDPVEIHHQTNVNDPTTITDTSVTQGQTYGFPYPDYFHWFRVQNDGTTITYSISPDGLLFKPVYSEAANSFLGTIDKVGFGGDPINSDLDSARLASVSAILWSWVETSP
jgi:hypothetical protein